MPRTPFSNLRSQGTLRKTRNLPSSGLADELYVNETVGDAEPFLQRNNNGTIIYRLLGDGRLEVPIQPSTPVSLGAGQIYLKQVGSSTEMFFVDAGGVEQQVSNTSSAVLPIPLIASNVVTVDSLLVDDWQQVEWEVNLANPITGEREKWNVEANHDGTSVADAVDAEYTIYGMGPDTGGITSIIVDLDSVGASQVMRLRVTAAVADWEAYVLRKYAVPA